MTAHTARSTDSEEAVFSLNGSFVAVTTGDIDNSFPSGGVDLLAGTGGPGDPTVGGVSASADDGRGTVSFSAAPASVSSIHIQHNNVIGTPSGTIYQVCADDQGGVVAPVTVATFTVTKDFSDNNPAPVEVHLHCDNGLPLNQSFVISDQAANPPQFFDHVSFVVKLFTDGAMDCTITETPIANYTPSYTAGGDSDSEDDNAQSPGCHFFDINFGDNNSCLITNTAMDATFTVFKEWEIFNSPGAIVFQEARVTAHCNNEIAGGVFNDQTNTWSISADLGDGDSLVAVVDTTERAAQCRAEERIVQSGVESVDNCGLRSIGAGGSSSCTFTNTVFFEGIPTLNHYGLALMALLMLGVGFVGFRRFA